MFAIRCVPCSHVPPHYGDKFCKEKKTRESWVLIKEIRPHKNVRRKDATRFETREEAEAVAFRLVTEVPEAVHRLAVFRVPEIPCHQEALSP